MTLTWIDGTCIVLYFSGLVLFGIFVRRTKGFEDFSVARRAVPTSMVFASLCGAFLGPGYSLGLAAKASQGGYLMPIVFLFFSLQTCLVGAWAAPALRRISGVHTLGEVMRRFYGPAAQIVTGIVSVGLCVGFAGVLARAGGTVLSVATGFSLPFAIAVIAGVGVLYSFTGGLKSVIATEAIQFGIVVAAMSATLLLAGLRIGSFGSVDAEAASLTLGAWRSTSASSLFGLCILFFTGEMLIPPYANRALAATSEQASRTGFVTAGIFSAAWFGMMAAAGILARHILPPQANPDGILVALAGAILPHGLLGLFLVAIAAIVMSTQESLLNAASVSLTRDLSLQVSALSDTKQLLLARTATLLFGALAVFFALRAPAIIDGLLICYSIWAPTVLPALLWGLAGRPTSPLAGVFSMVAGGTASATVLLAKLAGGDASSAVLVGICSSFVGFGVGFAIDRKLRGGR